jgi:hypothetical protein
MRSERGDSTRANRPLEHVAVRRTVTTPRLYRGLKGPYDPAHTLVPGASGVDFTDCPYTALAYATGHRGVVLVVEVNDATARVSEEFWLNRAARRFMIWAGFSDLGSPRSRRRSSALRFDAVGS